MEENAKVLKTEKAIQMAFIKITSEKGFNKMSIRDITETAHISRGTFYLHYLDKFDLLNHYENDLLNGIVEIFNKYPKPPLARKLSKSTYTNNAFFQMFSYLYKHKKLTSALLQNPDSSIIKRIKEIIAMEIKSDLSNGEDTSDKLAIPADYAEEIILQNVLVIITFWLQKKRPERPSVVFQIFLNSRQLSPINLLKIAY